MLPYADQRDRLSSSPRRGSLEIEEGSTSKRFEVSNLAASKKPSTELWVSILIKATILSAVIGLLLYVSLYRRTSAASIPRFPGGKIERTENDDHTYKACPNSLPRADIDLPSPLPAGLQKALNGLHTFLDSTVNSSFPAPLGEKENAAALEFDYRGKKLTTAFVGDKDPKSKSGTPDETTIFRIGSISKIFPVLMLYQLFDRGVVASLDDPLSKYAPGFAYQNRYSRSKRQFTLRQLASQLSGMQRELPCSVFDCKLTTKEIVDRLNQVPGAVSPEFTQPSYSNAAYALLGNVLADYVKVPFEEYVEKNILWPLGMHSTGFVFTDEVERQMAKPYVGSKFLPNLDIGYYAPTGQMYSNIKDLMTLGRYYLGLTDTELFDDGLRKELLMPGFIMNDGSFLQGAPWEIQKLKGHWLMLGKSGNVPGHSSIFGIIPTLNLSFAALWSGSGAFDSTSFGGDAYERVLREFVPVLNANRPAPALPKDPSKYVGSYQTQLQGVGVIEVELVSGKLASGADALFLKEHGQRGFVLNHDGVLNFHDARTASVELPNGADYPFSCFEAMAHAQMNMWIVFDLENDGSATAFELPGNFVFPMQMGVKLLKKPKDISTRVVV